MSFRISPGGKVLGSAAVYSLPNFMPERSGEDMSSRVATYETADDHQPLPCAVSRTEGGRAARWAALLDRAAEGDVDAFATFYDETAPLAFGLVMHILQHHRKTAEDTLSAVYEKIWAHPRQYVDQDKNPVVWFIDHARAAALARRGEVQHRTLSRWLQRMPLARRAASADALPRERQQANGAFAEMTEEQRSILQLTYFGGFSAREAAGHLGMPYERALGALAVAMQTLRRYQDA
jgi:RNA polymerase sigma-70 factor (ECF subfamily)